jgi:hypothetical protein
MKLKPPDRRRFKFSELPAKLKPVRPFTHERITKFDEFPDDQKETILAIKQRIYDLIGECPITMFGSRVNGNWVDESDYDFIIHKEVDMLTYHKVQNINHGMKVDVFFTSKPPTETQVLV